MSNKRISNTGLNEKDLEHALKVIENDKPEEYLCKGLFFRGYSNEFFTYNEETGNMRYEQQRGYRFLKKLSCDRRDCGSCDNLLDMLYEESTQDNGTGEIKNGALYELRCKTTFDAYSNEWDGELYFQDMTPSKK